MLQDTLTRSSHNGKRDTLNLKMYAKYTKCIFSSNNFPSVFHRSQSIQSSQHCLGVWREEMFLRIPKIENYGPETKQNCHQASQVFSSLGGKGTLLQRCHLAACEILWSSVLDTGADNSLTR